MRRVGRTSSSLISFTRMHLVQVMQSSIAQNKECRSKKGYDVTSTWMEICMSVISSN